MAFEELLNPIEHIWDEIDRRVRQRPNKPVTLPQLRQALQEEWNDLPQAVIGRVITSMRRRCQAVVDSNGGHTRY